jgi:hypothetical protein
MLAVDTGSRLNDEWSVKVDGTVAAILFDPDFYRFGYTVEAQAVLHVVNFGEQSIRKVAFSKWA